MVLLASPGAQVPAPSSTSLAALTVMIEWAVVSARRLGTAASPAESESTSSAADTQHGDEARKQALDVLSVSLPFFEAIVSSLRHEEPSLPSSSGKSLSRHHYGAGFAMDF